MRIISGDAKGRKVGFKKAFSKKGEGSELRPTSAKVRQAVFNIIGDRINGAAFLDLYTGTGAVGIEALSRGAGKVVFVDDNVLRIGIIREMLEKFGFQDKAVVIKDDAKHFLRKIIQPRVPECPSPNASIEGFSWRSKFPGLAPRSGAGKTQSYFDIIFIDPPYTSGEIEMVLPLIGEKGILMDNGIIIVEHSSKKIPPFTFPLIKGGTSGLGSLKIIKTYKYGDTSLSLYRWD